jgi:hypothetical protein
LPSRSPADKPANKPIASEGSIPIKITIENETTSSEKTNNASSKPSYSQAVKQTQAEVDMELAEAIHDNDKANQNEKSNNASSKPSYSQAVKRVQADADVEMGEASEDNDNNELITSDADSASTHDDDSADPNYTMTRAKKPSK